MRRIALLGSTGSIGRSALRVIAAHPDSYSLESMSGGSNISLLTEQIQAFKPKVVSVKDPKDVDSLQQRFPDIRFCSGAEGLLQVVSVPEIDTVITAITGTVPLDATIFAIRRGLRICLANKETLVAAGELIYRELENSPSEIIPIDSEQSAIFQSLGNNRPKDIRRVILTASGGPFYKLPKEHFDRISVQEALKHPTWNMGTKITIDSATLMNKALEIIEAFYLFNLAPDQIDAIIHPQSIIHSMVEFIDGSVISQMSIPDMEIPILFSLSYPDRLPLPERMIDFETQRSLEFHPIDRNVFTSIPLAYEVMKIGKNAGAVFNASNEVAVEAFLHERIAFPDIFKVVEQILDSFKFYPIENLEAVMDTIRLTKVKTVEYIEGII